ncbi:MAG TPA: hypothetical protein VHE12_04855 [bacterium]|nr:hypothetical protein [bacterium]
MFPAQSFLKTHRPLVPFLAITLGNAWRVFGPAGPLGILPAALLLGAGLILIFRMEKPSPAGDIPAPVARWIWAFLLLSGLGLRLWHLETYIGFPLLDEGLNAFYALGLTRHWGWHPFFFTSQLPPFYIWLLALAFKISPSLCSLWLVPALLSWGASLLAYAAARSFFSRSLSLALFFFTSIGFWPLYLGRFSHQAALGYFWEWLALWVLARFLGSTPPRSGLWRAGLGLVLGSGFYTYFAWPLFAGPLFLASVLWEPARKEKTRVWKNIQLAFWTLVPLFPVVPVAWREHFGSYFHGLWAQGTDPGTIFFQGAASYLRIIFGGDPVGGFTYGSALGGYLNPIGGALFFLGAAAAWKVQPRLFSIFLAVVAALALLPLAFTRPINGLRLIPWMPLAAYLCAMGIVSLPRGVSGGRIGWIAVLVGSLSFGMDLRCLSASGQALRNAFPTQRPAEFARAAELLRDKAAKDGPGLIFDGFFLGGPRLSYFPACVYDLNLLEDPRSSPGQAHWAALLTNPNYKPWLDSRFPGGRAVWLDKGTRPAEGGLMVWIWDLPPGGASSFDPWIQASRSLRSWNRMEMEKRPGEDPDRLQGAWMALAPVFQGDPFLRAFYWEKSSRLRFEAALGASQAQGAGRALAEPVNGALVPGALPKEDLIASLDDLQRAITQGIPAAHLYYRRGALESLLGRRAAAQRDFRRAVHTAPAMTGAALLLEPSGE